MTDHKPPANTRELLKLQKDGTVVLPPDVTEAELRAVINALASLYHGLRMKQSAPDKAIDA